MADKKEEHTAHSVASKIAKALLKVKSSPSHPGKADANVELPEYRLRNEREAALWYCLAAHKKTATRKQHESYQRTNINLKPMKILVKIRDPIEGPIQQGK